MGMTVDLPKIQSHLAGLGRDWTSADVARAARDLGYIVTDQLVVELVSRLRISGEGLGELQQLLSLPGVTDILVNGPDQVWIDRGRGLELTDLQFDDDARVRHLAVRLASSVGRRLDDSVPWVDARLPSGIRLHALLPSVADVGTCISLRIPAARSFDVESLIASGTISNRLAVVLRRIVTKRAAFLISGGTGSGKTTLLQALLSEVPASERLVVVEDSRELNPSHLHLIRLEGRPANAEGAGRVTMEQLVHQALRMRPDRVVIGEVRGAEMMDLLRALNTGHDGGCGTIHANSVQDVPARLEALAALAGVDRDACRAQVLAGLRIVIHIERGPTGIRRVSQIGVLAGEADELVCREALTVPTSSTTPAADRDLQRGIAWVELESLLS